MTIGELSAQTGVNIETVRYYERTGLIPPAQRSAGGRRMFTSSDVQRLTFIRRARQLGFATDEIRSLLDVAKGKRACKDAYAVAIKHRDMVRASIRDLRKLERTLSEAASRCNQGTSPDCALVEALSH